MRKCLLLASCSLFIMCLYSPRIVAQDIIIPALKVNVDGKLGIPIINERLNIPFIKNAHKKISFLTQDKKVEYGTELKVKDLIHFVIDTQATVRNNGDGHFFSTEMTWSLKRGYTYGASHGHPSNVCHSPADICWAEHFSREIPGEDRATFLDYYQTIVLTDKAIYVITVKDDLIWTKKSRTYIKDGDKQSEEYQRVAYGYMDEFDCNDPAIASEYAILKMYGDAIHLYKATDYDHPQAVLLEPGTYLHKPMKYPPGILSVIIILIIGTIGYFIWRRRSKI